MEPLEGADAGDLQQRVFLIPVHGRGMAFRLHSVFSRSDVMFGEILLNSILVSEFRCACQRCWFMSAPNVSVGDWIKVGREDALVLRVYSPGSIHVGYRQHQAKAVGEDAIWDGSAWVFESDGPNGTYLRGSKAAAVKQGPNR